MDSPANPPREPRLTVEVTTSMEGMTATVRERHAVFAYTQVDSLAADAVAQVMYRAMLALSFHPDSVLHAFEGVVEDYTPVHDEDDT